MYRGQIMILKGQHAKKTHFRFSIRTFFSCLLLLGLLVTVAFSSSLRHLFNVTSPSVRIKSTLHFSHAYRESTENVQNKNLLTLNRSNISEQDERKDNVSRIGVAYNVSKSPQKNISDIGTSVKGLIKRVTQHPSDKNISRHIAIQIPNGTPRPENCVGCFRHEFGYLINNQEICKTYNEQQHIDVMILILTTHVRRQERDSIRKTWLSLARNNTGNIRYAFLLGNVANDNLNIHIANENRLHGDILQENFKDAYANLTLKTLMGLKWATTWCPHARFVMKTDDDMWVNIPGLLLATQQHGKALQTSVGGRCSQKGRPIRNKGSKWYASQQSYPAASYPGFCSGTGYVTSMHVAKDIFIVSESVPFFHLEDVYVSLCVKKLGYHLHKIPGFHSNRPPIDPCVYKAENFVTSHRMTPRQLLSVWTSRCVREPSNNTTKVERS